MERMNREQLGPYRITDRLGQGAMGEVYRGEDADGHAVAIKVLPAESEPDAAFRARFEGEIETLKRLHHPNIVRLYGYGEEEGVLFYAMELVAGSTLAELLDDSGHPFSWREVADIGGQMARALRHAHDRGIVHRDIKPSNLMMGGDGTVKVADFGIARLWGRMGITRQGGLVGTANYMSPEQAAGRSAHERSDLYASGCVLYTLLAGRPPFLGDTMEQVLHLQRHAPHEPVSTHAPDVPPALEQVVDRLLEKDPEGRIGTAEALDRRLRDALAHGASGPSRPAPAAAPAHGGPAPERGRDESETVEAPARPAAEPSDQGGTTDAVGPPRSAPAAPADAPTGAGAGDPDATGPSAAAPGTHETAGRGESRFVSVDHASAVAEPASAMEAEPTGRSTPWVALGLLLLLGVAGLGAYQLARPASAAELYARIARAAERDSRGALIDAAPTVEAFRSRFPDHPKAERVERVAERIERARLARKLALHARTEGVGDGLTAPQRAYVAALKLADRAPAQALARFRAIADLLADGGEPATRRLRSLARERVRALRREREARAAATKGFAAKRLERAEAIAADRPATARRIARGLVTLYGDAAWARPLVERARRLLARTAARTATRSDDGAGP